MNHQDIDRRSLMMHRIIAERLRARPELLEVARENMARWNRPENHWWREWSQLLSTLTVKQLADLITRDDEQACRLRQRAPFVGILSPQEVWELKRNFKLENEHAMAAVGFTVQQRCEGLLKTEC